MPHIKIKEKVDIYKLPSLGDNDRPFVFELDEEDKAYLGSFNDVPKKIDYILQVSFFRIYQFLVWKLFDGIDYLWNKVYSSLFYFTSK